MATLSKSETRIRNIPSDHPACAGCAAQWVATPTSSRMNSDHVVLDPGRRGHRGNREDLCGFGGAEGDRTPDLMSAIHALSQLSYSPIGDVRKCPNKRTRPRDDISARTRSGSGELPVHDALDIRKVERLRDGCDRSDRRGPLNGVARGAESDEWRAAVMRPVLAAELGPVHLRHELVDDDQIRPFTLGDRQPIQAIACAECLMAKPAQRLEEQRPYLDIVLDDEHASAGLDLRHRALGLLGPSCEGQLRQADDEGRPLTGRGLCPDAPAMPRDDLASDVETEPEARDPAIVVRPVKALEDPREPVARDTWSFVSDRELELFAGARHTHGDGASSGAELSCVVDEVGEDLVEPDRIKVGPDARLDVDDQAMRAGDLRGGRRLARERGDVGRDRGHGQCPRLQLRRIEELPDERRKAIGLPHDRLELLAYVRRGVALECTLGELRVTADARHRSSQLVSGDREELLAEARGLLGDRPETVLGGSDLLFGALTVDDRGRESVGRDRRDGHECLQEQQRRVHVAAREGPEAAQGPPVRDRGDQQQDRGRLSRTEPRCGPDEHREGEEGERLAVYRKLLRPTEQQNSATDRGDREGQLLDWPRENALPVRRPNEYRRREKKRAAKIAEPPREPHRSEVRPRCEPE